MSVDSSIFPELPIAIRETIRLIGKKWSVPILHKLTHASMSFTELQKELPGDISPSVLNDALGELISYGIIIKQAVSVSPPRSSYFITDFGNVLCKLIRGISEWGDQFINVKSSVQVVDTTEDS